MDTSKVKSAAKWSIICEIIAKIISPITTIILARLLSQEVFGIVASLTAVTSLADLLSDAGFNAYIIQHRFDNESEKKDVFNICFWSNFTISVILFLIIAVNCDTFARLVGSEGYGNVLLIASLVIPLVSISSVEMAIMKRDLNFKHLGFIKIISKTIPFITSIPLALWGMGYWSLIIGSLIGEFVGCVLSLKLSGFIPRLSYNFSYLKNIFSFSSWAYLESILEWLLSNIPLFVLGSIYGIVALGVFKVGLNLINQIISSVYSLYSNVYKSAISKEQKNYDTFKNIFLTFQKYASLFSLPLGIGVLLYRNFVTDILLGPQWHETSIIVGLWAAMSTMSISFGNFYSDAIRAKGYPRVLVVIDFIYLSCILILLYYAHFIDFQWFCIVFCCLKGVQPLMQCLWGSFICGIKIREVLHNSYPQIIATICMAVLIVLINANEQNLAYTITSIIVSILVYLGLFMVITPDKAQYLKIIKKLATKRHG